MTDSEFHDAFHRHKDVVYRFAFRMTASGSTAEDVVQECFLALWRQPEGYDIQRGSLRAYLLGIARNLILKRWRSERQHELWDEESFVNPAIDFGSQER